MIVLISSYLKLKLLFDDGFDRFDRGGFGGAYRLGIIGIMYGSDDDEGDSPSLFGLNFGKLNVLCTGNDERLYLYFVIKFIKIRAKIY